MDSSTSGSGKRRIKRLSSAESEAIAMKPSKITKMIDESHNPESYITLIIEEDGDDDPESLRRTFWNLPVSDVEGVSDITGLFLSIVKDPSIQSLLMDEKVLKKKVWEKVAFEMSKLGYPLKVTNETEAGYKCNVKWKNLCRMHAMYLKQMSNLAGLPVKRKPKYFDEMDALLRNKSSSYTIMEHSSFSPSLTENTADSLPIPSDTSHCVISYSETSLSEVSVKHDSSELFNAAESNPATPLSSSHDSVQLNGEEEETKWYSSSDVVEFLRASREKDKKEREDDKKERNYQFSQLMARLDRDYELKVRLVDLLEQFLQTGKS